VIVNEFRTGHLVGAPEAKFPASRQNTGKFIDSGLGSVLTAAKKAIKSVPQGPIPYAT
jgi:hypothetical protein